MSRFCPGTKQRNNVVNRKLRQNFGKFITIYC